MNSNGNWEVKVNERVYRNLARFPQRDHDQVDAILKEELVSNPFLGDIKKMAGEENIWRRRKGSYRIFFKIFADSKVILVFRVERRTSKTY